jgi:hypothetical protein
LSLKQPLEEVAASVLSTTRRARALPPSLADAASAPRVVEVLTALDLFDDDTASTTRSWIQHSVGRLPEGFAGDVRAWLLVLLDGDTRTKPRAKASLHVYFSVVAPAIHQWSASRD